VTHGSLVIVDRVSEKYIASIFRVEYLQETSYSLLIGGFLLGSFIDPVDEGNNSLRNFGGRLPNCTVLRSLLQFNIIVRKVQ
jgi:hypothetical protein